MIYLKSVAAGLAGAVVGAVVMFGLQLIAFAVLIAVQGRGLAGEGSGGVGSVSVLVPTIPLIVFAIAGFVAGFWLVYRKRKRSVQR